MYHQEPRTPDSVEMSLSRRRKRVGKGRVFNSVLGHRPELYMIPDLVKMMLGGIQFVLGDLDADTTPSARLAAAR